MWIVCPNCENRFQVEPTVVQGRTFRVRCSRCDNRFEIDHETGSAVANSSFSTATPRPGTLTPPSSAPPPASDSPPREARGATGRPAELEELLREVEETYDDLMSRDPFALLGITVDSSNSEVMDAYFRLVERYRATRWVGQLTEDESSRLWQLMLRVDEAFNQLGDTERRRRSHETRVLATERKFKTDPGTNAANAKAALIKEQLQGDEAFAAGRIEEAKAAYQRCMALAPERAFFHLRVGQCLMHSAAAGGAQADWLGVERALNKALDIDPQNLEHLMALGEMWSHRGQPSRAMPFYKRVRDIEPEHSGANEAIESYLKGKHPGETRRTTTDRLLKFLRREK